MNTKALTMTTLALLTSAVSAQSIDPSNAFAWGENIGFLNFNAVDESNPEHVFVFSDHLAGFVWCENIGWLNLGPGAGPYTNADGSTFGVNRDPVTDELSGFAWSENAGWVNFTGGAQANPPSPARIENNRFRGFAWSENTGWINLDDDTVFVALSPCPPDLNTDGSLDFFDVSTLLNESIDYNADTSFDFFDISLFLQDFGAGCP